MEYTSSTSNVYMAAQVLSNRFQEVIYEFKRKQVQRAERQGRKNMNTASSALLMKRAHDDLINSLFPSSGTLLVVPNPLLKHWEVRFTPKIES